jgi:hypothetical protein
MPQAVTITTDAYSFDELSDKAKERARSWYRESRYSDSSEFDFTIEDFVTITEIIGISFDTHTVNLHGGGTRQEPDIWWSLSYSQGDGACFEGNYYHTADSCAKIREHAPQDAELHRIADELNRIQAAEVLLGRPTLTARIKKIDSHYSHENTVSIDVDYDEEVTGVVDLPCYPNPEQIEDLMRDLMRWLHKSLRDEDEYRSSDEAVDEDITANEYMFDEDGDRHAYA